MLKLLKILFAISESLLATWGLASMIVSYKMLKKLMHDKEFYDKITATYEHIDKTGGL